MAEGFHIGYQGEFTIAENGLASRYFRWESAETHVVQPPLRGKPGGLLRLVSPVARPWTTT